MSIKLEFWDCGGAAVVGGRATRTDGTVSELVGAECGGIVAGIIMS